MKINNYGDEIVKQHFTLKGEYQLALHDYFKSYYVTFYPVDKKVGSAIVCEFFNFFGDDTLYYVNLFWNNLMQE